MKNMLISIITATYNSSHSIERALNSIESQSYENIEHIIIDGASRDNTLEIIKGRSYPRRTVLSEPDTGIYNALNKGISLCEGEVVGLLHSDDSFYSNKTIELIAKIFKQNPNVDVVYGNLAYVNFNKSQSPRIIRFWKSHPFTNKNILRTGWMPPHPTLFIRRARLLKVGFFDENYRIAGDYDYVCRLFSEPDLTTYHINQTLVLMSTGGVSNNSIKNLITKSLEDYRIAKRHKIGGLTTIILKNISKLPQLMLRR